MLHVTRHTPHSHTAHRPSNVRVTARDAVHEGRGHYARGFDAGNTVHGVVVIAREYCHGHEHPDVIYLVAIEKSFELESVRVPEVGSDKIIVHGYLKIWVANLAIDREFNKIVSYQLKNGTGQPF